MARNYSDKIAFLNIPAIEDDRLDPIPWLPTQSYKNTIINQYNKILEAVCEETNIPLIDIRSKLSKDDLEDGIHPNSQGHQKITETVKEFIDKNWK